LGDGAGRTCLPCRWRGGHWMLSPRSHQARASPSCSRQQEGAGERRGLSEKNRRRDWGMELGDGQALRTMGRLANGDAGTRLGLAAISATQESLPTQAPRGWWSGTGVGTCGGTVGRPDARTGLHLAAALDDRQRLSAGQRQGIAHPINLISTLSCTVPDVSLAPAPTCLHLHSTCTCTCTRPARAPLHGLR